MARRVIFLSLLISFLLLINQAASYDLVPGDTSKSVCSVVYDVYATALVIEGENAKKAIRPMQKIMESYPNVKFIARTDNQVLSEPDLKKLINQAELIYLNNISQELAAQIKAAKDTLGNKKVIVFNSTDPELIKLTNIGSFSGISDNEISRIMKYPQNVKTVAEMVYSHPQLSPYLEAWKYCLHDTGGYNNYQNMFLYLLNQTVSSVTYAAYEPVPSQFIYHHDSIYPDLDSYLPKLNPDNPTVGIIGYSPDTYQSDDLVVLDSLISAIEEKGLNVICLLTRDKSQFSRGIRQYFGNVEAVINLTNLPDEATELFKNMDIPVFKALLTEKSSEEWEISKNGHNLSQIANSEMQGQIEPLVIAGKKIRQDEQTGIIYSAFEPINERISRLAERVFSWLELRHLNNSEKKIALIFYNSPPGKQNIDARYLAVPDSILSILNALKENGYTVDNLPATVDELLAQIYERGINVGDWTPGKLKDLAGKTVLWPAEEYQAWFNRLHPVAQKGIAEGPFGYLEEITKIALASKEQKEITKAVARWRQEMLANLSEMNNQAAVELVEKAADIVTQMVYRTVNDSVYEDGYLWDQFYTLKNDFLALGLPGLCGWGEPPGKLMTVEKEGKKYIIIPGIYYGNVFVAPQPLRGLDDTEMLYHNPVVPPPHQYLAFYAWLKEDFDAVIHLGCHGTHEWLPGKDAGLCSYDYPDITISTLPSIYLYIIDGVGEGLLAKRRGLSVIVDHLIPPLQKAGLYSKFLELKKRLEEYDTSEQKPLLLENIKSLAREMHLEVDLGQMDNLPDDVLVETIRNYLMEIESAFIPYGLHVFGQNWSDERIALNGITMVPSLPELLARARNVDYNQAKENVREEIRQAAEDMALCFLQGETPAQLVSKLTVDKSVYTGLDEALAGKLINTLNLLKENFNIVRASFSAERDELIHALEGGFIQPGPGNDPLINPDTLPTGRNFYGFDPALVPTPSAYRNGAMLADRVLSAAAETPEKIGLVLSEDEINRDQGISIAFGLRLLGAGPVWDENDVVSGVYCLPLSELGRPRVDVLFTAGGISREVSNLLDQAVKTTLAQSYHAIAGQHPELLPALDSALETVTQCVYGDESLTKNMIAKHWVEMTTQLINQGMAEEEAGKLAIVRVFGPSPGTCETRLPEVVNKTGTWDSPGKVADVYLQNMACSYSEDTYGYNSPFIFKENLKGVKQVYLSRSSNLYGVLDTDYSFSHLGGLGLAAKKESGNAPTPFIINCNQLQVENLSHFLTRELRSRYFNPQWVKGMMAMGFSGAHTIDHNFVFNFWGWQVVDQNTIQNWMWDEIKTIYIDDKYNLGVNQWLSQGNNSYAMISILGTMLVAAKKGFWEVDETVLEQIADRWAQLIVQMGPALCPICEDFDMFMWAIDYINPSLLDDLLKRIAEAVNKEISTPEPKEKDQSRSSDKHRSEDEPEEEEIPPPEFLPPESFEFIPPEMEWQFKWDMEEPVTPFVPEQPPEAEFRTRESIVQTAPTAKVSAPRTGTMASKQQLVPETEKQGPGGKSKLKAYEVEKVKQPYAESYIPLLGLLGIAVMVVLGIVGFLIQQAKG